MAASTTLSRAQRVDRARKAGKAAHTVDHYIARLVDRAPELTAGQRDKLATLLRPAGSGAVST